MPRLTLARALEMPAFRRARPTVLTGADHLDRPIRWVHPTELVDVTDLLRADDLVLTMGTGMPSGGPALDDYVRTLAEIGCAGVVVELHRRWSSGIPPEVVAAFERYEVPLVALTHEARFAELAQAVGERVVDAQLVELREAQRVHETFTELSFTEAGPSEVLQAVQRLAGGAVVLENARHRPLDYLPGGEEQGFLDDWPARSARVRIAGRTGWDSANGWLVTRLGTVERSWGRLVIAAPTEPPQRLVAVAERAAAALALHRLHDRDRDNLVRRTHRELVTALGDGLDGEDVVRRCELAGFPLRRRWFVAVVLRPRAAAGPTDLEELAASAVHAAYAVRAPALVHEQDGDVRVLLSAAAGGSADSTADRLAARVAAQHDVVVAAGRAVAQPRDIRRTLLEATHVADAVPVGAATERTGAASVHRLADLRVRGLLALLGDDERLRLFVDRELAPLRAHDAQHPGRVPLADVAWALVRHVSKTDAAASLHLSRAAFYDRLERLAQVLDVDVDDPDVRVSLHVALLAEQNVGFGGSGATE